MEFKQIKDYRPEYWEGKQNLLVRLWIYLHRGLDFVNQGRYWIIGTIGLYAVLKLTNPFWIIVMFLITTPLLIVAGRWHLQRVAKVQEFITTIKASVLGYSSYNVAVETMRLLEKNNQLLEQLLKK